MGLEMTSLPPVLADFVASARIAVTLADPALPDSPLVAANRAFCDMVGYNEEEVIGRNCRFLQPAGGAGPVRDRIRAFLASDAASQEQFVIANVRRGGSRFLNLVYIAKLVDGEGRRYLLGSQFDATRGRADMAEIYAAALMGNIRKLNLMAGEGGWSILGSYDALANSHRLIAQSRLDQAIAPQQI